MKSNNTESVRIIDGGDLSISPTARETGIGNAQAFLSVLKSADRAEGTIDGKTLDDWIAWAEDTLRDRDPLRNGLEGIFGAIARTEWNYRD